MATAKLTSKVFTGAYNTEWASKVSAIFDTMHLQEVYDVYGDGVRTTDLLQIAGRVMQVPNATVKHFERYAPQYAITLSGAIATGAAGADIEFKIATTDYDSNDNPPIRLYDSIEIPADYMPDTVYEGRLYRITSTDGTGDDVTFTASPFSKGGTYVTASQISTEVPDGKVLRIGHTTKSPGTGQPEPKTDTWAEREHVAAIIKESGSYEGGQMAQFFEKAIVVDMKDGSTGVLLKPILEVENRLETQIESYIVSGERTDNTGMTETSSFGGTPAVKSGFGFMQWAYQLAQDHSYGAAFTVSDLNRVKLLLQTQGVNSKRCIVPCGPQFFVDFEDAGLDYLQQYSKSDLLDAAKNLGVELRSVTKAQIQYIPIELSSFANPTTFGINVSDAYSYAYPYLGLVIPMENNEVKINGKMPKIPNIMLGYVNNNGEDRTRVIGIEAGPNKVFPNQQIVANDKDGWKVHMFTEVMVICTNVNRWVLIRKAK
jgi:hypothetical protein